MSITAKPMHIYEPTPLQCGQAVLAMLTDKSTEEIASLCGTDRETDLKQMLSVLRQCDIDFNPQRIRVFKKNELPDICILSLETPHCWHWSLYFNGLFYDPEYGILHDFPPSKRRYYWELYGNKRERL